jgi:signal peptidase II
MKKKYFLLLTSFLLLIEQGIKLFIYNKHMDSNIPIVKDLLYLNPMFNRDYSWINSLFGLGISKAVHIVLVGGIVVLVSLIYAFIRHKKQDTPLISTAFSFIVAGGLCSFIDKIFWDGSLDYIYLVNYFTFDLKDVYVNVFIGLVILMFIMDHQGFRSKDSDHLHRDFFKFVLRRH